MKKMILLFLFLLFLFPNKLDAASTNKKVFPYEISSITMNENEIVIEGWGMGVEKHHYNSTNTHYYSLELVSDDHKIVYVSTPIYNSQTTTMKVLNTRKCKNNEYYKSGSVCYYNYDYVGFKFDIPLSDLKIDEIYNTKLHLNSNVLDFSLSADVFYPISIPVSIMKDKIEYKIQSNLYDTQLTIADSEVFDRISPSKESKIRKSKTMCSPKYAYHRYFEKDSIYKNVYDRYKNESTIFYKVKTNQSSICRYEHNMIVEGNDFDSWIAGNWVDFSGEPLKIFITDTNQSPSIHILEHPTITNNKINQFNFKDYIQSIDPEEGNITDKTVLLNEVDLSVLGTHSLKLEVRDEDGKKANETLIVNVIEGNTPPVIHANDISIYQYETFDYLKDISAFDLEDGDLKEFITYEGYVNTNTLGNYSITYYAIDSKNSITSKTITVSVIKNPKEKIRYISNDKDLIFYKENIPINWIDSINHLIEQIQNPKQFIYKTIQL